MKNRPQGSPGSRSPWGSLVCLSTTSVCQYGGLLVGRSFIELQEDDWERGRIEDGNCVADILERGKRDLLCLGNVNVRVD